MSLAGFKRDCTPRNLTELDTKHDGFEDVSPLNMAILDIYVHQQYEWVTVCRCWD